MKNKVKSVQINVSIPIELNDWLKEQAVNDGRSLSNYIAKRLKEARGITERAEDLSNLFAGGEEEGTDPDYDSGGEDQTEKDKEEKTPFD